MSIYTINAKVEIIFPYISRLIYTMKPQKEDDYVKSDFQIKICFLKKIV